MAGIEITVSVIDDASAAIEQIASVAESAADSISSAMEGAGDAIDNIGSTADSAAGEVSSSAEEASGSIEQIGSTAEEAGRAAETAMDGVKESIDSVSESASNATDFIAGISGDSLESAGKKGLIAGAAMGGAAAGGEALAQSMGSLARANDQVAALTGITTEEMRNLVNETSNETFVLEDVLGTFRLAAVQGLRSGEALKEYGSYWDMVADAIGSDAPTLAKAGLGLGVLGVKADNVTDSQKALGLAYSSTAIGVEGFLRTVGRTSPELKKMGLGLNDTAILLAALSEDISDPKALLRAFREGLNEVGGAGGGLDELKANLGISGEKWAEYSEKLEHSGKVLEEHAAIDNKYFTTLDKMKQWLAELKFAHSNLYDVISTGAGILSGLSAPMMTLAGISVLLGKNLGDLKTAAVGAIGKLGALKGAMSTLLLTMKGGIAHIASFASGLIAKLAPALVGAIAKTWAWTAALLANPITWIVLGIVALIAGIVLLIKNFDKVKEAMGKVWDAIKGVWDKIFGFLKGVWDKIKEIAAAVWDKIKYVILGPVVGLVLLIKSNWDKIKEFLSKVWNWIKETAAKVWNKIKDVIVAPVVKAHNLILGAFNKVKEGLSKVWKGITSTAKKAWDGLVKIVKAPLNFIIKIINKFIGGLNKVKIPSWVPLVGGKGINIKPIPALAKGGIVTSPTIALLGESGAEAVVPLGKGGGAQTINHTGTIKVEGVNSQGDLVAVTDIVIEKLKRELRLA